MSLNVAGTFDIECGNWTDFVVGELLPVNGDPIVSWNEREFFNALVSQTGKWYAHAGGRYDIIWALDIAQREGIPWTAKLRGSGVLSVRLGECELLDSFAIIPMSLAKAAGLAGREAAKTDIGLPCECGEDCGGYCVLARPLDYDERKKVAAYLHNDCELLLAILDALEHRAEDNDISLRLTVGGSAWATAREWLDLPACAHSVGRYRRIREGYYGGRNECLIARAPTGHRYDIHSSYPAALARVALPTGTPTVMNKEAARAFSEGKEGIYGADLVIPKDTAVPPLPVRMADRLLYPTGPISGTWTALELRHAVEHGARLKRIRWGYVWPGSEVRLEPFASRVWRYRDDAAKAGEKAWAAWYKWLANSCTGKFAQRPEHASLSFARGSSRMAPTVPERAEIVTVTSTGVFYKTPITRVDPCAHVEWSAYLTAEARIELHRQLCATPSPIYCDTDSVYARDMISRRVGDELGEWGYEGSLSDWQCPAPKVYRYRDERGEWHVRGKGLPGLDSDGFDALLAGGTWSTERGVHGIRTALRRGHGRLFERRTLARSLHPVPGWVGGRELNPDGTTRPTTVARYLARET